MQFINWCNHIDRIKAFQKSEFFDICCKDDNIITDLYYGYITAIGEDIVCDKVATIYYGENSNFWIDYLVEDFINFGYAILPNFAETFDPTKLLPEIEADLDYQHGIPLETAEELFNFITKGDIPNKSSIYIPKHWAIRRSAG